MAKQLFLPRVAADVSRGARALTPFLAALLVFFLSAARAEEVSLGDLPQYSAPRSGGGQFGGFSARPFSAEELAPGHARRPVEATMPVIPPRLAESEGAPTPEIGAAPGLVRPATFLDAADNDLRHEPASAGQPETPGALPASAARPLAEAARETASPPEGEKASTPAIPLPKPGDKADKKAGASRLPSPSAAIVTVLLATAGVVGLFLALAWFVRRGSPMGRSVLSNEVVCVLGRAPLAGKQLMYLVRIGARLLLVSSGPDGVATLTEITDAEEVHHLATLCEQARPTGATATFRDLLKDAGRGKVREAQPARRKSLLGVV